MAEDRKIKRTLRTGGTVFNANASKEELDKLEEQLSEDDVAVLTEKGYIEGFRGKRDDETNVAFTRGRMGKVRRSARPTGTLKNKKGEPTNRQPELAGATVPAGVTSPDAVTSATVGAGKPAAKPAADPFAKPAE